MSSWMAVAVALAAHGTGRLWFEGADMGYMLLSLQAVLVCYWEIDDFESGLYCVIKAGGGTDTNGVIVCAVLRGDNDVHLNQVTDLRSR